MYEDEDEDEDLAKSPYVDGHWEWDTKEQGLAFISDLPSKEDSLLQTIVVATDVEFKDDIDLIEQQRYKKRLQRKSEGDDDVVTLQDVKDIVLYTAPMAMLSCSVINILHQCATERFLRGLILYVQYFLQIADEMSRRVLELEVKVRTQNSDITEQQYRENIQDLRLLVTKEYTTMILGGGDFRKYHHMGPLKKTRSLTRKDSVMYEAFIRLCVQIVYLALGRKWFKQIELEVNRIFRSQKFNIIDHKAKSDSVGELSAHEQIVLIGQCVQRGRHAMQTRSPLLSEIKCSNFRELDYRLLGLGVIEYPNLNSRLHYMERALITPEIDLHQYSMNLGIIGLKRCRFDTMLKEIKQPPAGSSSTSGGSRIGASSSKSSRMFRAIGQRRSTLSGGSAVPQKLYPDIVLPERYETSASVPDHFPCTSRATGGWSNNVQRSKWLARQKRWITRSAKRRHSSRIV